MATIVIKLDLNANQTKLIEAIEMLKGVKSVAIASDDEISDQFMANQMLESRKSGKGDNDSLMDFLSK